MNDKQQLAAMGEHIAEQQQHPLCMAKRIEELEAQVRVMAGLLREAGSVVSEGMPFFTDRSAVYKTEVIQLLRERIAAALTGKLPAPVVPEGWQLVPVEPTNEMIHPLDQFMRPTSAREIYRAMLAAAPNPEAK